MDAIVERLTNIIKEMVASEPSRLTFVFAEADDNNEEEKEADWFLKVDGKRCGRDLKLYSLMCSVGEVENGLVNFLQEVGLRVNLQTVAGSICLDLVHKWGQELFKSEMLDKWNELCDSLKGPEDVDV